MVGMHDLACMGAMGCPCSECLSKQDGPMPPNPTRTPEGALGIARKIVLMDLNEIRIATLIEAYINERITALQSPAGEWRDTQQAVDDALDTFIADLDRECGFTAYAPTVRAVQAAKKLARALPPAPTGEV